MRRVVSLYLPTWSTDRLRRTLGDAAPPADAPLVLVGRDGRRRLVLAVDMAARRAGLRDGTPATKAQALVPGLIVRDAEPAADAAALERLALWALQRYSPVVAADPPDGIVIDATGAAHLHGGEDSMLAGIVARLTASGIAARSAIADSWGAAHAFARYGERPVVIIPPGQSATAVLDLPIAALRLPAGMVDELRVLGFERLGELAVKPRAPLALRFGPELGRRLEQALGRLADPVDPVRPPDLVEVRRAFAEPIGAGETIARYTGKLVVELCAELEPRASTSCSTASRSASRRSGSRPPCRRTPIAVWKFPSWRAAFRPSLGPARREAPWAIKGLRDEPLPLFAAASARDSDTVPEIPEPAVDLRPMTAGGEVVEDYGHVGLTLRAHPVSFLRNELSRQGMVSCAEAMQARDGRWCEAAGVVLVRQRPGSAKGVMFITIEDETGIANLVIRSTIYEKQRCDILTATMAVRGRIQRDGEVVHLVAHRVTDLSATLRSVGSRDASIRLPHGRGDELRHGCPGFDHRGLLSKGQITGGISEPVQGATIAVKTRDFR